MRNWYTYGWLFRIHCMVVLGQLQRWFARQFIFTWFSSQTISLLSLTHQHLSVKEGSLFCFVLFVFMRSTKLGCFRLHSWSLWKALEEEGCIGLVSWRLDYGCRSSWILNDFFQWKLNFRVAENFRGIGMCLWCCWKDLDERDLTEFIW